ncbi:MULTISPECIES: ester cyclase [Nocardia]|uniref:ester cyclase n=1 Tax=Nocardia TaxID=1817 RepID=UPI001915E6CB|nr:MULTISPECIES: nuclear transport factor 2 family protein [Nocardia]UAK31825.1 ester cyclase [Nocardia asteroides]
MDSVGMMALATELAMVKSRQDVPAALRLMHPEMILEAPAFGTVARGLRDNEVALQTFFASFPDYDIELGGRAADGETLVCWGTARMTMAHNRFGVEPNGRRAELPVFLRFAFADRLIAEEYFHIDLAELCAQSGVSTDAVRRKLFGGR